MRGWRKRKKKSFYESLNRLYGNAKVKLLFIRRNVVKSTDVWYSKWMQPFNSANRCIAEVLLCEKGKTCSDQRLFIRISSKQTLFSSIAALINLSILVMKEIISGCFNVNAMNPWNLNEKNKMKTKTKARIILMERVKQSIQMSVSNFISPIEYVSAFDCLSSKK